MADDWRSPHKRQHIVRKIAETAQQYPGVLRTNPSDVEKAIYVKVSDKDAYMKKLGKVLLSIKQRGRQLLTTRGRGDPPGGMMFQPSMHPGQYHNQMQTMRGHPGMPPIMRPGSHPQYLMNTPQQVGGGTSEMMFQPYVNPAGGHDWRSPGNRQAIVRKIIETAQQYFVILSKNPSEIEEAIYRKVSDKDAYMNMVGKILLSIKQKGTQLLATRGGPGGMMFQPGMHPGEHHPRGQMLIRGGHPGIQLMRPEMSRGHLHHMINAPQPGYRPCMPAIHHAPLKPKERPSIFNIYHQDLLKYLTEDSALPLASKKLYTHQTEAVFAINREFTHHNSALVVLPTGCGKSGITVLAPYILNADKVLVITPSMTRTEKVYEDFCDSDKMFLLKRGIVVGDPSAFIPKGKKVYKTSDIADSLSSSLVLVNGRKFETVSGVSIENIPSDSFDLVIVDEAQHYFADIFKIIVLKTILDHFPNSKRLLLAATPCHHGKYFHHYHRPPCYELSKETAIARGIIRKVDFLEQTQLNMPANEGISQQIYETLNRHDIEDPGHKHQAIVLSGQTTVEAEAFVQSYHSSCPGDRCERYSDSYVDRQKKILTDFKNGDVRVLVVVEELPNGFDRRNVSVVGIAREVPSTSKVLFSQFVGRVLRTLHPNDPVTATVVSHIQYKQRGNFENYNKVDDRENNDEEIEEGIITDEETSTDEEIEEATTTDEPCFDDEITT